MIIETKFSLNDLVYPIINRQIQVHVICPMCLDVGEVTVNNFTRICPECYGSLKYEWLPTQWSIVLENISKVGEVRTQIQENKRKIDYMLEATGIGSGSIWKEDQLFLTKEEAQEECDRRNRG